jgi:hypothetical protein
VLSLPFRQAGEYHSRIRRRPVLCGLRIHETPGASSTSTTDAQLVRLSYLQGDVRFNRGDGKHADLKKP